MQQYATFIGTFFLMLDFFGYSYTSYDNENHCKVMDMTNKKFCKNQMKLDATLRLVL